MFFLLVFAVRASFADGGVVSYRLVDVDKHLFHVTMVFSRKLRAGVLSEVKVSSGSPTTKIENAKAIDVREKTDLRVEKGMVKGCAGLRIYISPEASKEEVTKHRIAVASGEGKPGELMVNVTIRVEADYVDSSSFFLKQGILNFRREVTGFETVKIILPKGYALIDCYGGPIWVYMVDGTVNMNIVNEKGGKITVGGRAVEIKADVLR